MKTTDMTPDVTRIGALDMQVCVPADWSDDKVISFANGVNPCGTEAGWGIVREGSKYLAGDPERVPCKEREGFVHIMLEA